MLKFDKKVKAISKVNEYNWESICARYVLSFLFFIYFFKS